MSVIGSSDCVGVGPWRIADSMRCKPAVTAATWRGFDETDPYLSMTASRRGDISRTTGVGGHCPRRVFVRFSDDGLNDWVFEMSGAKGSLRERACMSVTNTSTGRIGLHIIVQVYFL